MASTQTVPGMVWHYHGARDRVDMILKQACARYRPYQAVELGKREAVEEMKADVLSQLQAPHWAVSVTI